METEISYKELYNIGDHLILKLGNDIFEGDVSDLGKSRIDLINAKQHDNKNKLSGIYTFYRNEIDSIKKFKPKETEKVTTPVSNKDKDKSKLELSEAEYDRLKEMSRDFVYFDKPDSRYFQAIDRLSKAETIGVAGLGLERTRIASLKLLAVCTWDKVYLFDFTTQKKSYFYPEVKEILEAEYTCKVIHEAGPLLDVLYRNYKVFVKNTFDTQIVDMIIKKKQTGNIPASLSDVSGLLTDYFNFPSSYLNNALETTNKKWAERPLSDRRKGYAAQLVTYLITLKDCMQTNLFSEIYEAIEKIHDYYYYLDCFQFSKNWQDRSIPKEIQNLIPNLGKEMLQTNINTPPNTETNTITTLMSDSHVYSNSEPKLEK